MLKPTSELSDALICIAAATSATCKAVRSPEPAQPLEHSVAVPVRHRLRKPHEHPAHLVRMSAADIGCKDVGVQLQRLHLHPEHYSRIDFHHQLCTAVRLMTTRAALECSSWMPTDTQVETMLHDTLQADLVLLVQLLIHSDGLLIVA